MKICYKRKTFQEDSLYEHFVSVADSCPAPVIVYNMVPVTGIDLSVKILKKMSLHPNIVGVKDKDVRRRHHRTWMIILECQKPTFKIKKCLVLFIDNLSLQCSDPKNRISNELIDIHPTCRAVCIKYIIYYLINIFKLLYIIIYLIFLL